jgi:hypothetical protein
VTPQRWLSVQAGANWRSFSTSPVIDSVTPSEVVNLWYHGTAEEEAVGAVTMGATVVWACATPDVAKTAAPAITHVDGLNTRISPQLPLPTDNIAQAGLIRSEL